MIGLVNQLKADGRIGSNMVGSVCPIDEPKNLEGMVGMLDSTDAGELIFWDDVSGKMLKTEKVILARKEEIAQFRNCLLYTSPSPRDS